MRETRGSVAPSNLSGTARILHAAPISAQKRARATSLARAVLFIAVWD